MIQLTEDGTCDLFSRSLDRFRISNLESVDINRERLTWLIIKYFKYTLYSDAVRQWSITPNYKNHLNPVTDIDINIWKAHFEQQVAKCRLLRKYQRTSQATLSDNLWLFLPIDIAFDKYKEDATCIICRLLEKDQGTLQTTMIDDTMAIQLSKVLSIHEMIGDINKNDWWKSCQPVANTLIRRLRLEGFQTFPRFLEVEQSNCYQVQDKWNNYLHQARRSCENVQGQNNICNGFQHLQSTLLFYIGTNTNTNFSVLLTQILEAYHTLFAIEKDLKDKFISPSNDFRQGSDQKKGSIPSDNFRFEEKKCHNSPSAEGSRGSYKPRGFQSNRGIDKTKQETSQFMQKSHEETIEEES